MAKYGKWIVLIYAVLMLGGGIGGYAAKHSVPSLISGILSSILLGAAYLMLGSKPRSGYGLSLTVALILTGVFVLRAVQTSSEPKSMGRNVGLAVLSIVVAAIFGKCMQKID